MCYISSIYKFYFAVFEQCLLLMGKGLGLYNNFLLVFRGLVRVTTIDGLLTYLNQLFICWCRVTNHLVDLDLIMSYSPYITSAFIFNHVALNAPSPRFAPRKLYNEFTLPVVRHKSVTLYINHGGGKRAAVIWRDSWG